MICINCGHQVESLYVIYSGDHIRLTDCPKCSQVVDKYVEFDPVLLSIDLLLLKKGAYRHMTFNKLELQLRKHPEWKISRQKLSTWNQFKVFATNVRNWLKKYDQLSRLQVFLVAFEVYLNWVTVETKFSKYSSEFMFSNKLMIYNILEGSVWVQYLFFFAYVMIEMIVLHSVFQYVLINRWNWGKVLKYRKDIVYYILLISYGAKIFPILMLIWPYDTLLSTAIIKLIANIYIIEAVHIVTQKPYFKISILLISTLLLQYLLAQTILIIVVSGFDMSVMLSYIMSEYRLILFRMNAKKSLYL
ncbi:sterol homeostasis protein ARV1 [Kluyveromyces lactis]|uniref:Protein ARV n=1 Tax=Kluyveromyces lactis (strain ATCC 8585 / CBS 2359 / DSM 70799 / NBRC 1267 / NRRL Y-1140 / WM37) TaxID=284590 RepID=Q6CQA4_KLULA|nr:uncharacterized protein KLLA0_D18601g [Kluyveromyces lactis]CAH00981.1 KLLA0D18601p [Kluyveromyces lactis]|eukprot:XP_453885.1 uncharacterized protein KLLA0_D18601g [Kluyveromyces lactis]